MLCNNIYMYVLLWGMAFISIYIDLIHRYHTAMIGSLNIHYIHHIRNMYLSMYYYYVLHLAL